MNRGPAPGLCATCAHARRVDAARSTFWLCGLHQEDPTRWPRYPRIPVMRCDGHRERETS